MYDATWEPEHAELQKWDNWAKWVLFLLLGLSLTGRSFAYLGIPPAKLFVGDLTLAAFVVLHPRNVFDPWIHALTRGGPLGPVSWLLLGSLAYGIFEVIRGILLGFTPLIATEIWFSTFIPSTCSWAYGWDAGSRNSYCDLSRSSPFASAYTHRPTCSTSTS